MLEIKGLGSHGKSGRRGRSAVKGRCWEAVGGVEMFVFLFFYFAFVSHLFSLGGLVEMGTTEATSGNVELRGIRCGMTTGKVWISYLK